MKYMPTLVNCEMIDNGFTRGLANIMQALNVAKKGTDYLEIGYELGSAAYEIAFCLTTRLHSRCS